MQRRIVTLAATVLVALSALGVAPPSIPAAAAPMTGACGPLQGVPLQPIKHIVILMDENVSFDAIIGPKGSAVYNQAPNINDLATECGLATDYHAITHPSHSDYIAAVAGDTYVPSTCSDWTCVSVPLDQPSIFGQIPPAGLSWRTYAEDMTTNCQTSAQGQYSAGHNPPVWFTPIVTDCKKWAVPFAQFNTDVANNALPTYSWIIPNKCNDMHNCSSGNKITAGDTFIRDQMTKIMATPDYQNGSTVVFITWDEGVEGGRPFNEDCLATANLTDESCHVATIVASRWVNPGTRSNTFFTHYGLLKTTEKLMGLPYLRHAGDAGVNDMVSAFNLGVAAPAPDNEDPSQPADLAATASGSSSIHLTWTASKDNIGVHHYAIYRDGASTPAGTSSTTSFDDTGLSPSTTYSYNVSAVDAAGNESTLSAPASAMTAAGPVAVFSDTFETGNLSKWTSVSGLTVQQAERFAGSWAAMGTSTANGGRSAYRTLSPRLNDVWVTARVKIVSQGANNLDLFKLKNGSASIYTFGVGSTQRIISRNSTSNISHKSTTAISKGVWHQIQVHVTINGASSAVEVWLDGARVNDVSLPDNFGTTGSDRFQLGDANSSRTFSVAFDDVSLSV